MSKIDDVFKETRIEYGLQKPNWSGLVYGVCLTPGCGHYGKIGYYEGGFCKLCSVRHPDDKKLYALAIIDSRGTVGPNPNIRWLIIRKVKDLSEKLNPTERRMFYMTPEQRAKTMDCVDYKEPEEEEPDFDLIQIEKEESEDEE